MPTLTAPCQITVVDFSPDRFLIQKFDNATLEPFVQQPQPSWVKCRWISVNGLSWDVVKILGSFKNLHNLALEDLLNKRDRTKAEWYPTHAFMILTLQKLVHICDSDSDSSDSENEAASRRSNRKRQPRKGFIGKVQRLFRSTNETQEGIELGQQHSSGTFEQRSRSQATGFLDVPDSNEIRTLQQYHGVPNDPRISFMEQHSPLSSKKLAVTCEQVSMFINQDNSIISFFELSAQDVEGPIFRRLQTPDTILRQSCDASMVGQAIIDAIIDLAIPVTACYSDVIGDLELDVLTRPTLEHTKNLYIIITEINKIVGLLNPIVNLINTLRDHKTSLSQDAALRQMQDPSHAVIITPMTYTYLGDVLDHCVLILDSLNQLKNSADGMINLIFSTISNYQNESMKQLTVATIIFLPLTFLTGYFGQNFHNFPAIDGSISYL
ncbi:hypothetical protein B0T14DRAFT_426328 [Immersiella caudata]|uniref:Uncharacterized protein n=1 Tax=Immersiella caudata TaxID=314043 RepID=A0AA39WXW9_9PEZI|nr:hypothetical protein B0T14DRAFT_426328 [Immersiella caudata]